MGTLKKINFETDGMSEIIHLCTVVVDESEE